MNASVEASSQGPVKATWVLLLTAWAMFLAPIPFTGIFIGWPLNLVAFILSIVVLSKGNTKQGLILLLLTLVASPFIYFVIMPMFYGAALFGAAAVSAPAGI